MTSGSRTVGVLPDELTSFVGRRREASQAKDLLSRGRLVTLTGPGGIGKTRLALRVAAQVRRAFPGGVWLVELAQLTDGTLLGQTVVDALGLRDYSPRPLLEILRDHLAGRQVLLVLDNCEHLIDPCSALVGALLEASPGLKVVATSRQGLGVRGETTLPVPPLSLPGPRTPPQGCEAVSLFTQRAESARPDFVLTADKIQVIGEICHRLDGIPLAIELAAARARAMSAQEILHRLDDRLGLLTSGYRTAARRQQTLRATIDWSFDLCSEQERQLWTRLSVFRDGFDLEAAEEVCSGDGIGGPEILDLVTGLVDKSILPCEERGTSTRYRLFESLRLYGREKLADRGQEHLWRGRHLDWFRRLVLEGENDWSDARQQPWVARLEADHANIRAALEYSLNDSGHSRTALAMAGALGLYWNLVGALTEGRSWLGRALALDTQDSPERAKALRVAGWFTNQQEDTAQAVALLAEGRALAERLGVQSEVARTLMWTAMCTMSQGDLPGGIALATEALQRHRALGDRVGTGMSLYVLARAASLVGDPRSVELGEESIALWEDVGNTWVRAYPLCIVGLEMIRQGNLPRATALLQECLRIGRAFNDRLSCAFSLEALAWIAGEEGRHERAARLLGAARLHWNVLETSPHFLAPRELAARDRCVERARQALGQTAFQAAVTIGEDFSWEDAYVYALGEKAPTRAPARIRTGPAAGGALTPTRREREVAALIAQGLSNKEIAAKLVISRRTAEGHVEHILTKLGFTSRAQIATWATQQPE